MPVPEPRATAPVAMHDAAATAAFDAHRMDALAFLAAGIAHDLANPLGAMLAFASYLASDPRLPVDLRDDARLLRIEAERTHRMVRTLLEFARNRPAAVTDVSVDIVLAEVLELEAYVLADVLVDRDIPDDLPPVETDPSRLRHLLMVLTVEAIRRLGERPVAGRLGITARPDRHGRVTLTIAFERAPGRAPVIGGAVPVARAMADALGATLREAEAADGGEFVLGLPGGDWAGDGASGAPDQAVEPAATGEAADAATVDGAPGVTSATTAADAHTILVCDDEAVIRSLLVRILTRGGFRTLEAASGAEALRLLDAGAIDVVLTDYRMRGMSGIELFDRATEHRPHLHSRFVLMTGEPGAEELVRFADRSGVTILAKPFAMAEVEETIRVITAD